MKTTNTTVRKLSLAALMSGALLVPGLHSYAADGDQASSMATLKSATKEGWKEGAIEGAYLFNTSLNPLDIEVEVKGTTATLTGYVDSKVSKSLAKEIAMSVDGIEEVDNQLQVDPDKKKADPLDQKSLMSNVSDATITVKVKSKLLANAEVSGLDVNVDTDNREVTLSGAVNTDAERDLVYYIARNTDGVRSVNNHLEIKS